MAKEYIEKEAALAIIARKQNNSLNDVVVDACGQLYAETNSLPTQEDTSDTNLLDMLLEAINYTYKQLDGKYGNLSYVVSDKVKYIERVRAEKIEQKQREEYDARERGDSTPEADLDAEFERFLNDVEGVPRMYHSDEQIEWGKDLARHFAEWGAEHLKR